MRPVGFPAAELVAGQEWPGTQADQPVGRPRAEHHRAVERRRAPPDRRAGPTRWTEITRRWPGETGTTRPASAGRRSSRPRRRRRRRRRGPRPRSAGSGRPPVISRQAASGAVADQRVGEGRGDRVGRPRPGHPEVGDPDPAPVLEGGGGARALDHDEGRRGHAVARGPRSGSGRSQSAGSTSANDTVSPGRSDGVGGTLGVEQHRVGAADQLPAARGSTNG